MERYITSNPACSSVALPDTLLQSHSLIVISTHHRSSSQFWNCFSLCKCWTPKDQGRYRLPDIKMPAEAF